jgi:hypothetical protein
MFIISVNVAVYILASSQIYNFNSTTMPISPDNLLGQLGYSSDLTLMIAGIGMGAVVGGVLAWFTKQYMFGAVILLIWVIGMIAPVLQWAFTGLPIMMNAFGVPSYIVTVVDAFIFFTFFMGILEVASQRKLDQ